MINNKHPRTGPILAAVAAIAGCAPEPMHPDAFQGVVELEERTLAFEIPGRVRSIAVREGDEVVAGAELVRLDDTLETLARDARAAEARAVRADVDLLRAGSRPEDIRSLQAEIAAAKASEKLAQQERARLRSLVRTGVATAAEMDAADTAVATTSAQRRDLEARLARLRKGAREQELAAAEARAEAAETAVKAQDERIARHVLHTDGPGAVLDVHVELDEFAAIGAPVVTLGDVQRPYIDVFVPQGRTDEMSVGTAVRIAVDSHGALYEGVVEYVAPKTEFTPKFLFSDRERPNLVLRTRVRIDAPAGDLQAGVPGFVTPAKGGS
jgi:HlyD family secretion protein